MKIAVVCPYDVARPGGVQTQARELVDALGAGGDDARLVAAGSPGVGASVLVPGNRSRAPITLDPRAVGRVKQVLATVDVVHVHEPFMPLVGWGALGADRPLVATFHSAPARWTRALYRVGAPLGRRILAGRVVTAVSPVAAQALPASWGPVTIIPNGLDVSAYERSVPRDPHRVVFVGRDEPRKGLDVLVEAWPRIREAEPAARLRVVGAIRPPQPGIEYLGRVDEATKREELARASVFVAPNLGGESFGMVVAEAMAAGCAPVVSDLPAFRWVAGEGARRVPEGDPEALAVAVTDLLADPDARRRLVTAARTRVSDFDWSVVSAAYRQAYVRALAGDRS